MWSAFYVSADYGDIVQIVVGDYASAFGTEGSLRKQGYYFDLSENRRLGINEFLERIGVSYVVLKEEISNSESYLYYCEDWYPEEFDFNITAVIIDEDSDDRYMTVSAFMDLNNTFAWRDDIVFTRSQVEGMR